MIWSFKWLWCYWWENGCTCSWWKQSSLKIHGFNFFLIDFLFYCHCCWNCLMNCIFLPCLFLPWLYLCKSTIGLFDGMQLPWIGLVLLVSTWTCWIIYRSRLMVLLVLLLLLSLNLWLSSNYNSISQILIGRGSSELAEFAPLHYSCLTFVLDSNKYDSPAVTPRSLQDVFVNCFFSPTARLWNSLPAECFIMTYEWSLLKSWINKYPLFRMIIWSICSSSLSSLSSNFGPCSSWSA